MRGQTVAQSDGTQLNPILGTGIALMAVGALVLIIHESDLQKPNPKLKIPDILLSHKQKRKKEIIAKYREIEKKLESEEDEIRAMPDLINDLTTGEKFDTRKYKQREFEKLDKRFLEVSRIIHNIEEADI